MADERNQKDSTSSIVMKAIDATTFSELQAFTKDLESRPTERLLHDMADLVKPSDSKAQIVSFVIATKFRHADADEREKILASLQTTVEGLPEGEPRDRVNAVIERLRTRES
ncbi:MAG TPA: hypothetical protein VLV78_20965 [Thermoanaerobaculia bacterium]|nr:hypothetical protein [Thermoanaerobaculia bacterium]